MKIDPKLVLSSLITGQRNGPDGNLLSEAEWDVLGPLSVVHGVAPLLYQKLTERGELSSIPDPNRLYLKEQYYRSAASAMMIVNELETVLSRFQELRIPVMLLKGVSLIGKIYPDPALRPMADIDLMVRAKDLLAVAKILQQSGYKEQKLTYHMVFNGGPANNLTIEIHWNLMNSNLTKPALEEEWIWGDAISTQNAYRLRLEKELLYLTGHLFIQHHVSKPRLIWLYDIHLFIERFSMELNWDEIVKHSQILGWNHALATSIRKSFDYFRSEIVNSVYKSLPDSIKLASGDRQPPELVLRTLKGMSFWRGMKTIKGLMFPRFSYMQWRYNLSSSKFIIFYYPARWYALVKDLIRMK